MMGGRHPQKQLWGYQVNLDKRVRSGAVALGGTIILENSSITTSGDNAKGLHVLDANSTIFGTNLTITTSRFPKTIKLDPLCRLMPGGRVSNPRAIILVSGEDDWPSFDLIKPIATIVLTNRDHLRDAELFRTRCAARLVAGADEG